MIKFLLLYFIKSIGFCPASLDIKDLGFGCYGFQACSEFYILHYDPSNTIELYHFDYNTLPENQKECDKILLSTDFKNPPIIYR